MPRGGIYKLINPGQWVATLWVCPIEVSVVDAHSPLFVGFLDEDDIKEPL